MSRRFFLLGLLGMLWGAAVFAGEPEPLADALWRGDLTIRVNGNLLTQTIANEMSGEAKNIPIGFSKEKGQMDIDFELRLSFLVNALGETSLVAEDRFSANQSISSEFHRQFMEEKQVKKTRMKLQQTVRSSERRKAEVNFANEETYSAPLEIGSFNVEPSGRMDKRGKLHLVGDLKLVYRGNGKLQITEERIPPNEEYGTKKTEANLSRSFTIPIQIDQIINHRKKPIEGTLVAEVPIENPFQSETKVAGRREIFKPNLTVSGTYRLTPLF